MKTEKTVFLSYSHADKDFAERIATELQKNSIEVWWDRWEIKLGDSLVQKIFAEGLAQADVFLIVLSTTSVKSKWVREELDSAIVKKLEGVTRIIPVIKEPTEIPYPLRSLMWVDLSKDFDAGIRNIVKAILGVSEKPPIGKIPDYVAKLSRSVGGLSSTTSTVGGVLLKREGDELGIEKNYTGEDLNALLPQFTPQEINDAIDELREYGLVQTVNYFGTAPYDFGYVTPTYALFLHFKDAGLDYDPEEDIKIVASAIAAKGEIDGNGIREVSGLLPGRINRAVDYLEDYGVVRVLKFLGTAPFGFGSVNATRKTREFVSLNSV